MRMMMHKDKDNGQFQTIEDRQPHQLNKVEKKILANHKLGWGADDSEQFLPP